MKQVEFQYDAQEVKKQVKEIRLYIGQHSSMPVFRYPRSGMLSVVDSYKCAYYTTKRMNERTPKQWDNEDVRIVQAAHEALQEHLKQQEELKEGVYI